MYQLGINDIIRIARLGRCTQLFFFKGSYQFYLIISSNPKQSNGITRFFIFLVSVILLVEFNLPDLQ